MAGSREIRASSQKKHNGVSERRKLEGGGDYLNGGERCGAHNGQWAMDSSSKKRRERLSEFRNKQMNAISFTAHNVSQKASSFSVGCDGFIIMASAEQADDRLLEESFNLS